MKYCECCGEFISPAWRYLDLYLCKKCSAPFIGYQFRSRRDFKNILDKIKREMKRKKILN